MENVKKGVQVFSWFILIGIGILLFVNQEQIGSSVAMHSGGGRISYGSKTTLLALFVIEIVVNALFTFGYDIPFIKAMKRTKQPTAFVNSIAMVIQLMALFVMSAFILAPVL